MNPEFSFPEELKDFLCIDVVGSSEFFVGDLFKRKFGHSPPDFGKHIVVFYRAENGTFHVASYLHLWTTGTIGLVGGGCTDGRTLRSMSEAERSAIDKAGGLLLHTLHYVFDWHKEGLQAFFGHCGNDRALDVVIPGGLARTEDPYLLVRWNEELSESTRDALYRQALALGAF